MYDLSKFRINMYADGANLESIRELRSNPLVKGFTTNPTLMRMAGIDDYLAFAKEVVKLSNPLPVSLEVFADEYLEMKKQALFLAELGPNVYIKIPITNTKGQSSLSLINELASLGVNINVTAVFTIEQVAGILSGLNPKANIIISIFAGRIADTGLDPKPTIAESLKLASGYPQVKILWASPREIYNLIEAEKSGCHIITMTPDLWKKISNLGKDLNQFSLETVNMFFNDAVASGYKL